MTITQEPRGKFLQDLRSWWYKILESGRNPARADFKLGEWTQHLPWIVLVDAVRDDEGQWVDGLVKVYGSRLVQHFGGEMTGMKFSAAGEPFVSRWTAVSNESLRSRAPVTATGTILLPEYDFQAFEVLCLPLFDERDVIEKLLIEIELSKIEHYRTGRVGRLSTYAVFRMVSGCCATNARETTTAPGKCRLTVVPAP